MQNENLCAKILALYWLELFYSGSSKVTLEMVKVAAIAADLPLARNQKMLDESIGSLLASYENVSEPPPELFVSASAKQFAMSSRSLAFKA